jgi:hypothetical protein
MSRRAEQRNRTTTYRAVHEAIAALLYEVDPWRTGSAVGAPRDEYDEAAALLIPSLVRALEGRPLEPGLAELSPELVEQLLDIARPLEKGQGGSADIPER